MRGGLLAHRDGKAALILLGVALGREHDAAGGTGRKFHARVRERTVRRRLHDGEQVAFEQRQHRLRFGVAEAAVVLHDLRAALGEHQPEVEAAAEGAAFRLHRADRRQEDILHALRRNLLCIIRVRRDRAHAAGVGAFVAVERALVVHGGDHRHERFAVGEAQHRDLGTLHIFLDDDARAALTEGLILDHRAHGGLRLLDCLRDDDALAERETVRLDDDGRALGVDVGTGGGRVGKDAVFCGGNVVFLHQVLCKRLARLDDGGLFVRAEAGDARRAQRVHRAEGKGVVRRDNGIINAVRLGKFDLRGDVLRADLTDADRVGGDAAVAGQTVNFLDRGIFLQLFNDGVFATAAADDHELHGEIPPCLMMEQAHTRERHSDAVSVCRLDDIVVADRAARLDDVGSAALARALDIVAEGEKGV